MKHYSSLALAILSLGLFSFSLPAAVEFWDPNGATVGTSISGNWNTTTANWTASPDSGLNNVWTQGDDASFGVTANFTVTLAEPINLGSLTVTGNAGGLTIAGTAVNNLTLVGAPSTFNIGGTRTNFLSVPVVGGVALTKSGTGALLLSGANTYSGGTTLSAGSIGIGIDSVSSTPGVITSGALGTGTLNFSAAATIFASGSPRVVHNPVTLNGGLTNLGPQTLTLTNATLQLVGAARNITVSSGDLILGSNLTDDGVARTLTKAGAGRLVLAGDNSSFLGAITISAGTLAAGNSGPFPTNNANTITVNGPGILNLNGFDAKVSRLGGNATGSVLLGTNTLTAGGSQSAEFSGVISGAGRYIKVGSVSQVLSGTNTFTGGITITEGALYLPTNGLSGSPISLAAGTNTITITGNGRIGANRSTGTTIITNSIILNNVGNTAGLDPANGNTFILTGRASGSGGFLRYSQGGGIAVLAGDNTFTGGVELDAQRLGIGHPHALGTGTFTIGNPTVAASSTAIITTADLSGANAITNVTTLNQSFAIFATNDFELSGPMTISNLNPTIVTSLGTSAVKFSGNIDGDGSLNKQGTNNLVLTGANTYLGGTTVTIGTLLVNNTSGSGTGTNSVTVVSSATLAGKGTIAGPVLVGFGGSIGGGNIAGKLTLQNGLDLSSGGASNIWELAIEKDSNTGTAGTDFGQLSLTAGDLALGSSSILHLQFLGSTAPTFGHAFWRSNHTWKVIALSGTAANPGNSNFSGIGGTNGINAGTFSTAVDGTGSVILSFAPLPAPPSPVINSNMTGAGTGNTTITWSAVDGVTYQVQYKDDLTAPNWIVLGSVTASGSSASFTDTTSPAPDHRFYRILAP